MAQRRTAGGVLLLLATIAGPPAVAVGIALLGIASIAGNTQTATTGGAATGTAAAAVGAAPAPTSLWRITVEESPIDDSKNIFANLLAKEETGAGFRRAKPTLVLRCKEHKTEAYIDWNAYLGLDETRVLLRIDRDEATTSSWTISTDNKATFHRRPVEFAKSLVGREQLLAQVTPYSESPALVTFPLLGIDDEARTWEPHLFRTTAHAFRFKPVESCRSHVTDGGPCGWRISTTRCYISGHALRGVTPWCLPPCARIQRTWKCERVVWHWPSGRPIDWRTIAARSDHQRSKSV